MLSVQGQNQGKADSLITVLTGEKLRDSLKFNILKEIAWHSTRPSEILSFAKQAFELASKNNNANWMALSTLYIGDGHKLRGDLVVAIEYYLECARYAERAENNVILASVFNNIGTVYFHQENYHNSIHYLKKAVDIYRVEEDTILIASSLLNLGEMERKLGSKDSALVYFEESKKLFDLLNYKIGIAYNLGNVGLIYGEQGKYDRAEDYINQAIEILKKFDDYYPISVYQIGLSDIYEENGEQLKAMEFAMSSYKMAKERGLKEQIRDAGLKLSKLYQKEENYDKAYFYQNEYLVYRDSINNEETVRKIADLRTEYEVSNKQAEVDILNQKSRSQRNILVSLIVILVLVMVLAFVLYKLYKLKVKASEIIAKRKETIEAQRNQLDALNRAKDRFFSILSHDLRGPVGSFQGVSELLKDMVHEKKFDELASTAGKLEKSARQLSLLLDNLLGWALSQQGEFVCRPEKLSLSDVFESTIGMLENMAVSKNQTLTYQVSDKLCLWADRDSTLAIFRNLIGNALKFTKEEGKIDFTAKKDGEMVRLNVKDTGLGMSREKLSGIFNFEGNKSSWGTRGEKGMGLGLVLVHEFVEMNKGRIEVDSEEGIGTNVTVWLPLFLDSIVGSPSPDN